MDLARIHTLLRPFAGGLAEPQFAAIAAYVESLLRWNARLNLTAVRTPEEIVTRHWGESLFAAQCLLKPGEASAVVDVGSGAGFPGLACALYAPAARVTLIEAQQRKATFLKEAARTLALKNVTVFAGRAEDYDGVGDLVTLRAVERFADALAVAAGLVRPGGRLALLIGEKQVGQAQELGGLDWAEPVLVPQSRARVLLVGTKPKQQL